MGSKAGSIATGAVLVVGSAAGAAGVGSVPLGGAGDGSCAKLCPNAKVASSEMKSVKERRKRVMSRVGIGHSDENDFICEG